MNANKVFYIVMYVKPAFVGRTQERGVRFRVSMEIQYRGGNRSTLKHHDLGREHLRAESRDIIRFTPAMKFPWEYETSRFCGAR